MSGKVKGWLSLDFGCPCFTENRGRSDIILNTKKKMLYVFKHDWHLRCFLQYTYILKKRLTRRTKSRVIHRHFIIQTKVKDNRMKRTNTDNILRDLDWFFLRMKMLRFSSRNVFFHSRYTIHKNHKKSEYMRGRNPNIVKPIIFCSTAKKRWWRWLLLHKIHDDHWSGIE